MYRQSPVYEVDAGLSRRFDDGLEPMERKYRPCQEEFYIHSHSVIRDDPGE